MLTWVDLKIAWSLIFAANKSASADFFRNKFKLKHPIYVMIIFLEFGIIKHRIYNCISEILLVHCLYSTFRIRWIQKARRVKQ